MSDQEQKIPKGAADESRRRFTKAGLAGSGIILTLASKQVIAGGGAAVCESPSGFSSINTSAPGKTQYYCGGLTPGYWKTKNTWPCHSAGTCSYDCGTSTCTSYKSDGTKFHSVFAVGAYCNLGSETMMNTMWKEGNSDKYKIAAHFCATELNICAGKIPSQILTKSTMLTIWNSYVTKGYYSPMSGVKWYGTDIVTYLKSTMPA